MQGVAKLYSWSCQDKKWVHKKDSNVEDAVIYQKYDNSTKLTNQTEENFFNKFDLYNSDGNFIGSILTLNVHLFI